jgi:hypothetical protein
MTAKVSAISANVGSLGTNKGEAFRFGDDNSGQLAGFRNILINGKLTINQRGVTIAAAANGSYGPDRWKKVDASNMTQIVEAGNFKPSTTYTLSGTNVTTAQIVSPASGDWTLPNIPITALNIQLEQGSIATPFEQRPIGLELSLCQRYYTLIRDFHGKAQNTTDGQAYGAFPTTLRSNSPTMSMSGLFDEIGVNVRAVVSATTGEVSGQGFRMTIVSSGMTAGNQLAGNSQTIITASAEL